MPDETVHDQAKSLRTQEERYGEGGVGVTNESLPPRKEYHRNRRNKEMKIKIKFPVVRLLLILFLLIVALAVTFPYWNN